MTTNNNYAAFAVQRDGGWTAHYGAPGDEVKSISDDNGQDYIYGSQAEAEEQAAVRLVEILQGRWARMKRYRPDRDAILSSAELIALIEQAELTVRDFAILSRVRGDYLANMLTGERKVSPSIAMMAEIFARSKDAIGIADDIHEAAHKGKPRRSEP